MPAGTSASNAARRRASSSALRTKRRAGYPAASRRGGPPAAAVEVSEAPPAHLHEDGAEDERQGLANARGLVEVREGRAERVELEQHVGVEELDVLLRVAPRRAGAALASLVGERGDAARRARHRVALRRVEAPGLQARQAHGQRVQVGADRPAAGDHRLDEHRARAAEGIEHHGVAVGRSARTRRAAVAGCMRAGYV